METGNNQPIKGIETKLPEILVSPESGSISPELSDLSSPENNTNRLQQPNSDDAKNAAEQNTSSSLPASLPPLSKSAEDVRSTGSKSISPVSASDEDVLSQEWVDAAKKIIKQTEGEPFKRDDAVAELREDYKVKRYGSHDANGVNK